MRPWPDSCQHSDSLVPRLSPPKERRESGNTGGGGGGGGGTVDFRAARFLAEPIRLQNENT